MVKWRIESERSMSNPDDHDLFVLDAYDYYYGDLFSEAEEKFKLAISHNPQNALAYRGLHEALAKQGKDTQARNAIYRSLELNPNDPVSWFCLAQFLDGRDTDISTALDAYHQGLKLDPSDRQMWRNLSILYKRAGDLAKSEEVIRQALRMWPEDRACLAVLEWNLRHQDKFNQADEVKARIIEIEVASKRRQEELDREIAETIRETLGFDPTMIDDDDDDEEESEPYELNYITKIYDGDSTLGEENKDEDEGPLIPNPHKTDISSLFGDDEDDDDEFTGFDLFGDDEDDTEESKKSSEDQDDEDEMAGLGELFYSD